MSPEVAPILDIELLDHCICDNVDTDPSRRDVLSGFYGHVPNPLPTFQVRQPLVFSRKILFTMGKVFQLPRFISSSVQCRHLGSPSVVRRPTGGGPSRRRRQCGAKPAAQWRGASERPAVGRSRHICNPSDAAAKGVSPPPVIAIGRARRAPSKILFLRGRQPSEIVRTYVDEDIGGPLERGVTAGGQPAPERRRRTPSPDSASSAPRRQSQLERSRRRV